MESLDAFGSVSYSAAVDNSIYTPLLTLHAELKMRLESLSLVIEQSREGKDVPDHARQVRGSNGTPRAPEAMTEGTAVDLWEGVEWQGAFLAIERPSILRLKK